MIEPTLHTSRLTLRRPTPDDIGAYQAFYAVSDLEVGKYRGGQRPSEVAEILKADLEHWETNGFGMWLMVHNASGEVIGGAGLVHPSDWPRHELTWWLMPTARGQGFASEASQEIIAWAYDHLGWPQAETHMRDENTPARNLAQRLGGKLIERQTFPDGVARDIFAFPKGEFA